MKRDSEHRREESGAHHLAALLRNDATQALDGKRDQADWQRLLLAAHKEDARGARGHGLRRAMVPVLACAVCAAVAGLALLRGHWDSSPLHVTLDGHEPTGPYVVAEAARPRDVGFSDGSRLVLHATGRLRLARIDSRGATLALERGTLDLAIRHLPAARWDLDVGPYVVGVTGTRFSVSWDPESGEFGVDLLEGAVAIRGPGISTSVALQVGQRFRANKGGGYTVQRQAQEAPAPPALEIPGQGDTTGAKTGRLAGATGPERATIPSPGSPAKCDWADLVSTGQFQVIVSQARRMGIANALAGCPCSSLFALADAARYLGKLELSRRALLTVRKRSPHDAGKAAFFLGRLEEAGGNLDLALDWYAQALQGDPAPHLAQEAKAARARVAKRVRALEARSPDAGR